jgi:hypothetical protein
MGWGLPIYPLAQTLAMPSTPSLIGSPSQYRGSGKTWVCVECLIGKQKKPILFKVTEPVTVSCEARPRLDALPGQDEDDDPFIVLPETKFSIPIYLFGLGTRLSGPGLKHMR